VAYFVLAYALAWMMIPLSIKVSVVFGLLALFGPAISALCVTGVLEGRAAAGTLLRATVQGRPAANWIAAALALPVLASAVVVALNALLLKKPIAIVPNQAPALTVIIGVMVVGEEIGWRGFALPRLQRSFNSLTSSLILGGLWAAWHLPNAFIPGLGYYLTAFPVFLVYVVAMSVLFTWLANGTGGSIWIAWLFHAAIDVSAAFLFIGDSVRAWGLSAAVFAAVAIGMIIITGPNLRWPSRAS
jgi:membrane protease YdiL (CAAX protease family)